MNEGQLSDLFGGAATVGERGQVVIPAEIREKLAIKAGDKLLVFAHPHSMGVLFLKLEKMIEAQQFVDAVLNKATEETMLSATDDTECEGGDQ